MTFQEKINSSKYIWINQMNKSTKKKLHHKPDSMSRVSTPVGASKMLL